MTSQVDSRSFWSLSNLYRYLVYLFFLAALAVYFWSHPLSVMRAIGVWALILAGFFILKRWIEPPVVNFILMVTALVLIGIVLVHVPAGHEAPELHAIAVCTANHPGKLPPCFYHGIWNWFPSWLPWEWFKFSGTMPCLVQSSSDLCLDRYSVWELCAIFQTALIAALLFSETAEARGFRVLAMCLFVVLVATAVCLLMTLTRTWLLQLLSTLVFLLFLLASDLVAYFMAKRDGHLERAQLLWNTAIYADIPPLLGNLLLVLYLEGNDTPANHVFFSGVAAFGLLSGNVLILIFRIGEMVVAHRKKSKVDGSMIHQM